MAPQIEAIGRYMSVHQRDLAGISVTFTPRDIAESRRRTKINRGVTIGIYPTGVGPALGITVQVSRVPEEEIQGLKLDVVYSRVGQSGLWKSEAVIGKGVIVPDVDQTKDITITVQS